MFWLENTHFYFFFNLDATEAGEKIVVNIDKNGKIVVDGHKVMEKDILAANGITAAK